MEPVKRKVVQVIWTIDVSRCIAAAAGLLYALHEIGLLT